MNNRLFSKAGLVVLALTTLALTILVQTLFRGTRLDLTEDQLYTLSQGTRNLVSKLDEPVTLKFYFSRQQTEGIPQIRNYANRIQELLQEYAQASGGNIKLDIIDPEPFSEQEDEAAGYGLQAVPLSMGGKEIYMGVVAIAGQSSGSDKIEGAQEKPKQELISFFSPDKERFLEYDISHLIYTVTQKTKPKLAVISSIPVSGGGFDMATRQPSQPWMSISQLSKLYQVQNLGLSVSSIPDDISLLVLVLPDLSPETQYAVDQYVLRGGHALIFLDPYAEAAGGGMQAMGMGGGTQSAYLERLLGAWGVEMVNGKFVADEKNALTVGNGSGRSVRHLGIMGLGPDNMNSRDAVTGNLKTLNFASAGALQLKEGATVSFEPLVQSSDRSALLDASQLAMMFDPKTLYKEFNPTGDLYTLAARITGSVKTAFPDGKPKAEETKPEQSDSSEIEEEEQEGDSVLPEGKVEDHPQLLASEKPVNIIVVSDTDVISNRLWVQVANFFGQQVASPFASNGDMVVNMVDNLTGNADLISIRSRGQFSRPFTRVDELERQAQARFLKTEEELSQQLQTTENRLMELQMQKQGQGKEAMVLSAEQTQELQKFQQEKLKIRKQLRDVQHQLNRGIDRLGSQLKMVNILLIPVLLTIVALFWKLRRRKRLH